MKPYGYIYLITNTLNGKIYIGQKASPKVIERYYGSGRIITRAIKKYGIENFTREILCWKYSKKTLDKAEIDLINEYDSRNIKIGYNICIGGKGGQKGLKRSEETINKLKSRIVSEETRIKMSEVNKGNKNSLGYKQSEEHKNKRSEAYKGKKLSEETRNKMKLTKNFLGHKHTEEAKKKISEAIKKLWESEETRIKMSESAKGNKNSLGCKRTNETKKKISESQKGINFRMKLKRNYPRLKNYIGLSANK
jgi:group I intron endonuclease